MRVSALPKINCLPHWSLRIFECAIPVMRSGEFQDNRSSIWRLIDCQTSRWKSSTGKWLILNDPPHFEREAIFITYSIWLYAIFVIVAEGSNWHSIYNNADPHFKLDLKPLFLKCSIICWALLAQMCLSRTETFYPKTELDEASLIISVSQKDRVEITEPGTFSFYQWSPVSFGMLETSTDFKNTWHH